MGGEGVVEGLDRASTFRGGVAGKEGVTNIAITSSLSYILSYICFYISRADIIFHNFVELYSTFIV